MHNATPTKSFESIPQSWGQVLRAPGLSAVADHFFTTRQLRLRGQAVEAHDWARVARAIGVEPEKLLRPRQVHGREVVAVTGTDVRRFSGGTRPDADVVITDDPSLALAVQVADCVPVLMADRRTGAVAATHAGWRGTAAGVVQAAVAALASHFGARAGDLVAALGPSIGPCCYAVGQDVVEAFAVAGHSPEMIGRWFSRGSDGRYLLDLWAATCDELAGAGVAPENIHAAQLCTAHDPGRFFSYRAEGSGTGRMAAVIRPRC
jgi:polyphenol oxidase